MKKHRPTDPNDYKRVADRMWDDIFNALVNKEKVDHNLIGYAMVQCNKADWAIIKEEREARCYLWQPAC